MKNPWELDENPWELDEKPLGTRWGGGRGGGLFQSSWELGTGNRKVPQIERRRQVPGSLYVHTKEIYGFSYRMYNWKRKVNTF
jgi:hypothetical protein